MEDHKLKFKFKISRNNQEALFAVQPRIPEDASAAIDVKEDGVELEEGEIRKEVPNEHKESQASKKKSCPHCGREFSNGKALGGHLRVHTENPSIPKPDSSGTNLAQHQAAVHRCIMCHKRFSSKKGLFGHMRSHPERQYRGMQPSVHLMSQNPYKYGLMHQGSGSGHGQPVVELLRGLEGWKVKGKRGRKGRADASSPLSSSLGFGYRAGGGAADEMMAVEVFCHFANNGISDEESFREKSKKEEFDEDELYFLQHFFELTNNSDMNPNTHINSVATTNCQKKAVRSKKNVAAGDDNCHITKGKIIEDDDDDDDEKQDEKLEKKWKCSSCNKTFQTHQALGGHRSSHNGDSGSGSGSGSGNGELQYKCKICSQSFSSGKALGGHRRSHFVQSSSEQIISHTGRKDTPVFEFDLNLMAEDVAFVD